MYQLFHGCAKGYSEGSKKDEKCITPISNCYWNNPNDVINSIKTQSQTKNKKLLTGKL